MQLHINPHDGLPVYRQIQRQIASAIAARQLLPGERLQPHRQLAAQLAISPTAVRKAYAELQAIGLCRPSDAGELRVSHPALGAVDHDGFDLTLSLPEKALMLQELETARHFQSRLLPPHELSGDGWMISSRCYPAGALAGDFLDVIVSDDGRVDVVVADVAGKGLAAGLIMATTKSLLPLAATMDSPATALEDLNDRLHALLCRRQFVALAWARFNPRNGELLLANAGLPDPHLLHPGGSIEPLVAVGERLPLGIRPRVAYRTLCCRMAPAERLLMFTDGLPEARDPVGNPLGYEGLRDAITTTSSSGQDQEAGLWLDHLLERISCQTGSILEDDWTTVLLGYGRN